MTVRIQRSRQRFLVGGSLSSQTPAAATQSTSVVKYPGGFDQGPPIIDDLTPLVAQWHNYLSLMVEAVMAEVGPIGKNSQSTVGNSTSLMRFLGVEGAARLSLYKSVTKSEAGQLFGVMKAHVSGTGVYANNVQTTSLTNHHGGDPGNRVPLVFACTNQLPTTSVADMAIGPTVMRCDSTTPSSSGNITVRYRACAPGGGSPSGGATHSADLLVFFMPATF